MRKVTPLIIAAMCVITISVVPCHAQLVNVALNKPATASAMEANAYRAVDGDEWTSWNAEVSDPAWWAVDLENDYVIREIRLRVSQTPSGDTHHRVCFYVDSNWLEVLDIQEYTFDQQWLEYQFDPPIADVSRVFVKTISTPSSVAWFEIEVYSLETELPILTAELNCIPIWGTGALTMPVSGTGELRVTVNMTVSLTNNSTEYPRRFAGRIGWRTASGLRFPNWRSGCINVGPGDTETVIFNPVFYEDPAYIGMNAAMLFAMDVTPAPYNQPPYPPSGATDTDICIVEGNWVTGNYTTVWGR
jgi:hypothetical protein